VAVVGTGVLKMFKIADQSLKPLPLNANRRDSLSFTCQTWVPLADRAGDAAGAASTAADTGKGSAAAAAASSVEKERQLMGTLDGEVLLFEVSSGASLPPAFGSCWRDQDIMMIVKECYRE
jgi:hypothetical protein